MGRRARHPKFRRSWKRRMRNQVVLIGYTEGHRQHRIDTISPLDECGLAHVFTLYGYNYYLETGCGGVSRRWDTVTRKRNER